MLVLAFGDPGTVGIFAQRVIGRWPLGLAVETRKDQFESKERVSKQASRLNSQDWEHTKTKIPSALPFQLSVFSSAIFFYARLVPYALIWRLKNRCMWFL